ncbi:MAG: 3'-5' exonuclease, partial [Clostridiales bacterium]|nr:3'-5' exonuclease [Clostridiales bacterium]
KNRIPKQSDLDAIDSLEDNEEIIACGAIRRDIYSKDLVFIVSDINRCKIDYSSIKDDDEDYNDAKEDYELIKPEEYIEEIQQDFFSTTEDVPEIFMNKDFVVFDCETTGLDRQSDKIIELAAVKIKSGIIREVFSTFVNPGEDISAEITKLTSITNGDLAGAPKIEDVFHDFYKFIKGCALVAHNIEFDMGFIRRAAEQTRYKIDNDIYDTMTTARKKVRSQNYKLGTLCELLKIELNGAHRAINDAIATAKLFLALEKITANGRD